MKFNITDIAQLSNDQIIDRCHDLTTKLPLVIMFAIPIILFLFFGLLLVKQSRVKLLKILAYTFFFSGIVFLILYLMPITVTQNILDFFAKYF